MSSVETAQLSITSASDPVLPDSDAELLHSFVTERRHAAFEKLMRRHGPMVMGVCRRVLPERHHAEDAYQTTFLLLVQKSATIRRPEQLSNWLFGVAYRVAARIREKAGKQEILPMESVEAPAENTAEAERRELQSILDEELRRLPDKYRLPLILCYLEGKTHIEAARELGWPSGSMSSRLTQARETLRRQLARRGLTLTSAVLGMLLGEQAYGAELSHTLIEHTTRAATAHAAGESLTDDVSARVAGLAAEMSNSLFFAKTKAAAVLALLVLLLFLLGPACDAVRIVHGEVTDWAAQGSDATQPGSPAVESGTSDFFSLARPSSPDAAVAPNASASFCSESSCQH